MALESAAVTASMACGPRPGDVFEVLKTLDSILQVTNFDVRVSNEELQKSWL